VNRKGLEAL